MSERRPDGTHYSPSVGSHTEQRAAGVNAEDGPGIALLKVQNLRRASASPEPANYVGTGGHSNSTLSREGAVVLAAGIVAITYFWVGLGGALIAVSALFGLGCAALLLRKLLGFLFSFRGLATIVILYLLLVVGIVVAGKIMPKLGHSDSSAKQSIPRVPEVGVFLESRPQIKTDHSIGSAVFLNSSNSIAMGYSYLLGDGVVKDPAKAFSLFLSAAEQDDRIAQALIGAMYYEGAGTPKNLKMAFAWTKKSAEQGELLAKANLGAMYFLGVGVGKDDAEALKWSRAAADEHDGLGENNLGVLLSTGSGVERNINQAFVLFLRAARNKGYGPAQANLAESYFQGQGTARNYSKAYYWFLYAQRNGQKHLSDRIKAASSKLSDGEIALIEDRLNHPSILYEAITAEKELNEDPTARYIKKI